MVWIQICLHNIDTGGRRSCISNKGGDEEAKWRHISGYDLDSGRTAIGEVEARGTVSGTKGQDAKKGGIV